MKNEFYISQEDWDKLQHYAQAAYDSSKSEIGGMLIAEQDKDGDWELKNPVIVKQEISGSNCILDREALAEYYTKVGSKMGDKDFRFVWWHSHHTMEAFWSGTDLSTIEEDKNSDYSFSLVINLRQEYKFRVSVWKPFEIHKDVELTILSPDVEDVPEEIVKEVAAKCSSIKYSYKSGWSIPKKGKDSQLSLINQKEYTYGSNEADYGYAYSTLDTLLRKYCDGTLYYSGWVKGVKALNNKLVTEYNSIYEVELTPESVLTSKAMMCTPHEFIILSDQGVYEECLDEMHWNNSFGVKTS
tara:strand:- start:798 stop:1694 length:897 start_codon:yes stop_codon:yes gene_type:complete